MRILFLILFCLSCSTKVSTLYMYGLFSLSGCANDNYQCRNAKINADRMIKIYNPNKDDIQKLCVRDMKEDVGLLYSVLFEIIENPTFDMTGLCKERQKNLKARRDRLIVFTYLSFELTRIVSSMLLPNEIVVLSVTEEPMYPSYYLDHSHSYYSYQASLGEETHKSNTFKDFMKKTHLDDIVMLDLTPKRLRAINHRCRRRDSSAFCLYVNQYSNSCFREKRIDVESNAVVLNKTIDFFEREHYNFVVLDGSADLLGRFSAITDKELYYGSPFFFGFVKVIKDQKWDPNKRFSSHRLKSSYRNGNVLINFHGAFLANKFLFYLNSASEILVYERAIWEGFRDHKRFREYLRSVGVTYYLFIKIVDPDFVLGSVMTFDTWSKIPVSFRSTMISLVLQNKEIYLAALEQGKSRSYIEGVSFNSLQRQDYFNPTLALEDRKMCNDSIQICGKGRYLKHGHFKNKNWTRNYGWFCQRCPEGFFKETMRNVDCKKCSFPLRVNDDHTRCYDPFTLDYLRIDHPFSVFWLVLSSVQFLLILITIFIFIVHRNTPIVLSSIKEMTAIQLLFHLLLTVALPLLFIGKMKKEICSSRPIVVGISLSVLISVMLSKTQKVFFIFNMKVRVTSSEKFISNSIEWFIILFTLIVDAIILTVSFTNQKSIIDAIFIYDNIRLVKELTCNNNDTLLTQLIFTLFLVFLNCIQGYRARNLPSNYKEVTYVIYSSFISVVVLVAITVIYFLQNKYLVREIVLLIGTGTLNFVNFALIYFYKVYIILFCPHLNTKKAFNEKRKEKIQKQFQKTLNSPRTKL